MKIFRSRIFCLILSLFLLAFTGCSEKQAPRIGVAFGVGSASRWISEIQYMEEYAKTLDIQLETRFNNDETKKTLVQDCMELIDNGIDVLIVRPRDVKGMKEVVDYAHEQNVKIISYDSLIENEAVDLFVGYDSEYTGQLLGRYLSELVLEGDYILLWGDMNRNVEDMYRGAMKYLEPLGDRINILLEYGVPGWSTSEAKTIIKETVTSNGNHVDAILAFNDSLAGACAEALAELGVETPVLITGMDAEINAVRRIVAGTQACTAYMDLKKLACTAIDEALSLATGQPLSSNSSTENGSGIPIPSYLLPRQIVTKQNLDRVLIDSGYYSAEQVYGETAP